MRYNVKDRNVKVQVFRETILATKDKGFLLHASRTFTRVDPITGKTLKVKRGKSRKVKFITTMRAGEPLHVKTTHTVKHPILT